MVEWKIQIQEVDNKTQFHSTESRSGDPTLIQIFFGMMIGAMAGEVIPKYLNACEMDGVMRLVNPEAQEVLGELGITISVDEKRMAEFCKGLRASDGTAI